MVYIFEVMFKIFLFSNLTSLKSVEIKCQLDATDDFYCRTFCLLNKQQLANRTHNPQLHTIPTT